MNSVFDNSSHYLLSDVINDEEESMEFTILSCFRMNRNLVKSSINGILQP